VSTLTFLFCVRREDGIWCCRDARERLYLLNAHGEICSKPKIFDKSSGKYNDQRRPEGIISYVWWNMMNKDERKQCWIDHPETSIADSSVPAICCRPRGISSLLEEVPTLTLCSPVIVGNYNLGGYLSDASDDEIDDQVPENSYLFPWEIWETLLQSCPLALHLHFHIHLGQTIHSLCS
ncbi:MAG: hypothetical protein ACKPKO_56460, partial [Candidatus Fonsibacter sp.]